MMVEFQSDYTKNELIQRWDEYTSISRFAGSDETMDLIFVSKRKGNKVKLTRRAIISREPFSSIFRAKIVESEKGSAIVGYFTKSVFGYFSVAAVLALLFYIRTFAIERGEGIVAVNTLIACAIVGGIALLLNTRRTKRIYADFICRITGKENDKFLTKQEKAERESV